MLSEKRIRQYIEKHIQEFRDKRLERLHRLKLKTMLRGMNPFVFRANGMNMASDLVGSVVAAYLSPSEKTFFGGLLENLARFVCEQTYGGRKSATRGIDLEFEKDGIRYFVSIKSGPNWGNAGQKIGMKRDFTTARKTLRTNAPREKIMIVEGVCYGASSVENRGEVVRLRGQRFWSLISGNDSLYIVIINQLVHGAKEMNEALETEYAKLLNRATRDFMTEFCDPDGSVLWEKLLQISCGARKP